MSETRVPGAGKDAIFSVPKLKLLVLRLVLFVALAFGIGAVLNRVASSLGNDAHPAGFGRGVVQGALMPMALPNLLVGRDVAIYSSANTGVRYKLGYTVGVNVCGAFFFGMLYWRISRLARKSQQLVIGARIQSC